MRTFIIALSILSSFTAYGASSSAQVNCGANAANPQVCAVPLVASFSTTAVGPLTVSVSAPSAHCSHVKYDLYVDGVLKFSTPFLAPGASSASQSVGQIAAGAHTLKAVATGKVGGCNTGKLNSVGVKFNYDVISCISVLKP
jgi:hypothetical protein